MGVMMGLWDCRHCGAQGNPGPKTKCPQCSAPRDPDVKFYLPEGARQIEDQEELRQAEAGVDWNCAYCGADNKATEVKCRSCGHAKDTEDKTRTQKEYAEGEVPHSTAEAKAAAGAQMAGSPPPPPSPPASKNKLFIGLAVFLAIIGIIAYLAWPRATTAQLTGVRWERTVEIQQNKLVEEESWEVPSGATIIRSFRAVHHHDQVIDRYETKTRQVKVKVGTEQYVCGKIDMGNGYFKDKYCTRDKFETREERYQDPVYRQEPVFQTKYAYNVYRWKQEKINKASGTAKPAKWPDGPPLGPNVREGKKTEEYTFLVTDKDKKEHQIKVDTKTWDKFNVGDKLPAKKNAIGGLSLEVEK